MDAILTTKNLQSFPELSFSPLFRRQWSSIYESILKLTTDIKADKLIRLRPNRCLWTAPPPYSGKGRPRVHGDKFKLSQLETYPPPDIFVDH